MMEFFYNIYLGLMENKDQILMFLTSSSFISLVVALIGLWRTSKTTKANTSSTNSLKDALDANSKVVGNSDIAVSNTEEIKTFLLKLDERLAAFEAKVDNKLMTQAEKVNAIIEVQSIVYSTIKDEKVRNTVNNLLVNAKYAETATRAELKRQIEDLKKEVASKAGQLAEFVAKTSTAVAAIVDGDKAVKESEDTNVVERY
jgi:hypothetical protein